MSNHDSANGGGYGNTGAQASAQRQQAQITNENPTPSAQMAADFNADGSIAQMAGVTDGDTTARPDALNSQSQIAYDYEEE